MPSPEPRNPALVHDWLTGMRGGEKVLERFCHRFPGAPIYTLFHFPGSVSEVIESHPIRTSFLQRAPGIEKHYRRYLPAFPAAIEDLDLSGHDLVLSSSHCVAKGVIPDPGALHVCYCHTPMRYAWDQERAYFPDRRGVVARLRGMALHRLRTWDAASTPRVDAFLANSRFVASRIRRYYGREAQVLHPPVDTGFFADPAGGTTETAEPYALAVSALAPYKRLDVAIEACRRAGLPLKIVGTGPERERLQASAGPGTSFLGRVEGDELRRLLRGASYFLQPGVEDFGIAPVEALAAGTPVVAAGEGGVLDIVEDGVHGVLYPPDAGADGLVQAIDMAQRLRFNELDLGNRAEIFSSERFDQRLTHHLARLWPAREVDPTREEPGSPTGGDAT
jgi:glycosyltransferase involved in cell wall biosynthesis